MEIKILTVSDEKQSYKPILGEKTDELLSRFNNFLDEDELEILLREANEILSNCTNPNLLQEQDTTHLTVGYVQSGKTLSFTALTALAADNGFRIIIYFAGTKNNLLSQTTKRLTRDLIQESSSNHFYKIFENPTKEKVEEIRGKLRLSQRPTVLITVLKHYQHISNLANIFKNSIIKKELGKHGVLIIDDEADQASLNGFAFANSKKECQSSEWDEETSDKESSTYASILALRSALPNHSYVQYTATPQGPLLISILDLLSPKSHSILTPGKRYTGGKTFFQDFPDLIVTIPEVEVYHPKNNPLVQAPSSLKNALQVYILGVALIANFWNKEKFLSMMVHADRQKEASRLFHKWVKELIERWTTILTLNDGDLGKENLYKEFKEIYENEALKFYSSEDNLPTFDEIKPLLADAINDTQLYLIISEPDAEKEIDWDSSTSHILIGADMLNRGYTVENLAVTYMPRYSKGKSNADTIQQRCRFFGYKQNYLKSCRVYLPLESIIEYVDYVNHEEEMRNWLLNNKSLENVVQQLIIAEKLNLTRKNILPYGIVQSKMRGWHQMNALHSIESNNAAIDSLINDNDFKLWSPQYNTIDRNHKVATISVDQAIKFLTEFKFGNFADTARKQATIRYLQYLSSDKATIKITQVYIIQMAFESEYRERDFNIDSLKINQLFSGPAPKGKDIYPGDREIKYEDSICIQIHKVKLKSKAIHKLTNKIINTIAIYYPNAFATSFVSNDVSNLKTDNTQ